MKWLPKKVGGDTTQGVPFISKSRDTCAPVYPWIYGFTSTITPLCADTMTTYVGKISLRNFHSLMKNVHNILHDLLLCCILCIAEVISAFTTVNQPLILFVDGDSVLSVVFVRFDQWSTSTTTYIPRVIIYFINTKFPHGYSQRWLCCNLFGKMQQGRWEMYVNLFVVAESQLSPCNTNAV